MLHAKTLLSVDGDESHTFLSYVIAAFIPALNDDGDPLPIMQSLSEMGRMGELVNAEVDWIDDGREWCPVLDEA